MSQSELIALVVLVFFLISAVVAYQAAQRGYSFFAWVIAGMLGNPVFFLVLLAIMPDYARKARRRQELADLEVKLASRLQGLTPGESTAQDPAPATFSREVSVGDQPTVLPRERSLGDEETRG